MSQSRSYSLLHNGPVLLLLALLIFLPVYGPYMVSVEGYLLPVTSMIEFIETTSSPEGGMDVRFSYHKLRQCEVLNVTARRGEVTLDFDPVSGSTAPRTRILGEQTSRLWHLGAPDLDGLEVWFFHRCHPLWTTVTKVYG